MESKPQKDDDITAQTILSKLFFRPNEKGGEYLGFLNEKIKKNIFLKIQRFLISKNVINEEKLIFIKKLHQLFTDNPDIMSILTNIAEESGGNPFAKHGEYFGLLQWSPERYNKLSDDFYTELNNQLKYIIESSKNENDKVSWTHGGENSGYKSYKNALDDFNSKDINKSIKGLTLGYVRPKGKHDSVNNRINAFNILKEMFDEYKSGGVLFAKSGIHIKPENRGKFTALKKRTGKSSTWYKEHGTPAQKKMAIFALNSKHWHHGNN